MSATLLLTHEEIQQGVRALAGQVAEGFPAGQVAACHFAGEVTLSASA